MDVIDNCPLLFNPKQDDVDGDTVGDARDNCNFAPNPDQGPAAFAQQLLATTKETFSWPTPSDVRFVKGDLATVATPSLIPPVPR